MLLDNTIGFIGYLFLPNDCVWALLTSEERAKVKQANFEHNNYRPDYADPECYSGGKSFDSTDDRLKTYKGVAIQRFLNRVQPNRVVEIGPGSGYYTRQIIEYASVREYVAVDINAAFLKFVQDRLSRFEKPSGLVSQFVTGDATAGSLPIAKGDAVICLSAVHHIPDRALALANFAALLRDGGEIFAIDPTHYFERVRNLVRKCRLSGYLTREYRETLTNISTHHFCTLGEFRRICRKVPSLTISEADFWYGGMPSARWRSTEMAICLRKQGKS